MFYTAGIDVGSNSIKTVIMSFDDNALNEKLVSKDLRKIRKSNTKEVAYKSYEGALFRSGFSKKDIQYVSTTGEGEMVDFRTGHFYSMTAHARGALFLNPEARTAIDAGALHTKAFSMDQRSKVLAYKMTSQCAAGSGQFLENISRYLGIPINEVGELSKTADSPEMVSSICAVLAETDVINMVSRGIKANNILCGIHKSMASRVVNLLRALNSSGTILVTGGLALNGGFVATLQDEVSKEKMDIIFCTHKLSSFAGAIGTAIWGGFRYAKLKKTKLQ